MTSASHHTTRSPVLAASVAHSALPLPWPTPWRSWTSPIGTTVAPASAATTARVVGAAVVEHDQLVDEAGARRRARRGSCARASRSVATSSRHGMHTDTVRPRLGRGDRARRSSRRPRTCAPRSRRSPPVASAAVFLYGVVNASPDSLHDGLDRHDARRGGRAGPPAAGRRRRRHRPRRPGLDRRGHGRRLDASSGRASQPIVPALAALGVAAERRQLAPARSCGGRSRPGRR